MIIEWLKRLVGREWNVIRDRAFTNWNTLDVQAIVAKKERQETSEVHLASSMCRCARARCVCVKKATNSDMICDDCRADAHSDATGRPIGPEPMRVPEIDLPIQRWPPMDGLNGSKDVRLGALAGSNPDIVGDQTPEAFVEEMRTAARPFTIEEARESADAHKKEAARIRVRLERQTTIVLTSSPASRRALRRLHAPLAITFTRLGPTRIRDTADNLRTAFKAVKDAVATVLGIDDGDERSTRVALRRAGEDRRLRSEEQDRGEKNRRSCPMKKKAIGYHEVKVTFTVRTREAQRVTNVRKPSIVRSTLAVLITEGITGNSTNAMDAEDICVTIDGEATIGATHA